jgi:hypothetical protein
MILLVVRSNQPEQQLPHGTQPPGLGTTTCTPISWKINSVAIRTTACELTIHAGFCQQSKAKANVDIATCNVHHTTRSSEIGGGAHGANRETHQFDETELHACADIVAATLYGLQYMQMHRAVLGVQSHSRCVSVCVAGSTLGASRSWACMQ